MDGQKPCRCRTIRPKLALAGSLAVAFLAGPILSSTVHTSAVSVSLASFCLLNVTSSAVSLTIANPATPGAVPSDATNESTYAQYSSTVAPSVTRRVTAAWAVGNSAPAGCALKLLATPPSGMGATGGQITVSDTAQNVITGIGGCATGTGGSQGAKLGYSLSVTSMTTLVAGESKNATITLTMTDS